MEASSFQTFVLNAGITGVNIGQYVPSNFDWQVLPVFVVCINYPPSLRPSVRVLLDIGIVSGPDYKGCGGGWFWQKKIEIKPNSIFDFQLRLLKYLPL